jgi:hypothetical protein
MADRLSPPVGEDYREAVSKELRRLHEDLLYTEKAHFMAAQSRGRTHRILGLLGTVGAAIAAGGIIADEYQAVAGVAALVAAIASAVLTFRKPEEAAEQHLGAGRDLGALRVQVRQHLSVDLHASSPTDPSLWRAMITTVSESKASLDRSAPPITDSAFQEARLKIESGDFSHEAGDLT